MNEKNHTNNLKLSPRELFESPNKTEILKSYLIENKKPYWLKDNFYNLKSINHYRYEIKNSFTGGFGSSDPLWHMYFNDYFKSELVNFLINFNFFHIFDDVLKTLSTRYCAEAQEKMVSDEEMVKSLLKEFKSLSKQENSYSSLISQENYKTCNSTNSSVKSQSHKEIKQNDEKEIINAVPLSLVTENSQLSDNNNGFYFGSSIQDKSENISPEFKY